MAAAVLARTERARVMISACDPAAARPDPDRGADRGARQRVPGPAVGRRSAPATASRSSRWPGSSTRRAAASSKSTSQTVLRGARRASRSSGAGRNVVRDAEAGRPIPRRMLFVGGGVPAAARRAARLRLPMFPMNTDPAVRDAYFDEAKKIGFDGGFVIEPGGPTFVYVAEDPERAWAEIGPYVLYEVADVRVVPDAGPALDCRACTPRSLDDLQAVAAVPGRDAGRGARGDCRTCPPMGGIVFNPLAGGHAARAGVAEPRAVRGEGAAAPARDASRRPRELPVFEARISGVPSRSSPDRRSAMARYRRFDVPAPARSRMPRRPSSTDVRLRRAGLKAAMSGLELALAAPAPHASSGSTACATRCERCTRCGRATSSRPKRPARSSTSSCAEAPRLATPASRLRREHSEILARSRAPRSGWRSPPDRRRLRRPGSTSCAPSSPTLLVALGQAPPARRRPRLRGLRRRHRRRLLAHRDARPQPLTTRTRLASSSS